MNRILLVVFHLVVGFTSSAQQLTVSDAESKIAFVIKNIGLDVDGTLKGLKGTMQFDAKNLSASAFDMTVDVNTINTGIDKRDNDLKKEGFFDIAKYPAIRIATTQIVSKGGNNFKAIANLTIKNITRKIGFDFTATPTASGYSFLSSFTINRRDFGVGGSSMIMGDIVKVNLSVGGKK